MSGVDDAREAAMAQLPAPYALALRLRKEGLPLPQMAVVLGVDVEAVGPLLTIAEAKLATIMLRRRE